MLHIICAKLCCILIRSFSTFNYEKIISIFGLFINHPILQQFCNLYNDKQQRPEKDYEYELKEKDKEIEKL